MAHCRRPRPLVDELPLVEVELELLVLGGRGAKSSSTVEVLEVMLPEVELLVDTLPSWTWCW